MSWESRAVRGSREGEQHTRKQPQFDCPEKVSNNNTEMLQHHLRIGRSGDEPINCKRPGQFMASSSGVNSGVWQTRTRRATCKGFEGRGGTYDFTHIGSRLLLGFGIVIKVFDE